MSQTRTPALALLALLALATAPGATDAPEEWQDPTVSGRNREPAHATMLPYATVAQALEGTREASPFYLSLNGGWKFHYVDKPGDRPRDFFGADFDDAGWATIPVPSNWQLQGYDKPIYLNTRYPWAPENPDPPHIPPGWNPVGSYRTTFEVPAAWAGRQGLPPLRRGEERLLRLGERAAGGLQRGQHDAGRVRRHALPEDGREPAGGAGLPLVGRQLPGGPGHLAPLAASTATSSSTRPRASASPTSPCAPTSTTRTATPPSGSGRGCAPRRRERRGLHRRGAALRPRAPAGLRGAPLEGRDARSWTRSTRSAARRRSGSSRRRSRPRACGRRRRPTSTPSSCR